MSKQKVEAYKGICPQCGEGNIRYPDDSNYHCRNCDKIYYHINNPNLPYAKAEEPLVVKRTKTNNEV